MGFWQASVQTRPMPGVKRALASLQQRGIPVAVLSNCSFGSQVIWHELTKHDLSSGIAFVMVSADYSVRKPNPTLFETAAAKLGVLAKDIWFIGDQLDTDVAGANSAEMTSVWFNPCGLIDASNSAALSISSWHDLETRIAAELKE